MSEANPLVSVVLSMRNEEHTIPEMVRQLDAVLTAEKVDYEIIYVNDASTDRSLDVIKFLGAKDRRIKSVNLSRKFGYNQSFIVGLQHAKGDLAIMMDSDLQDPPSLIPQMLAKYREGADVVHTIRTRREGESAVKMWLTSLAYRVIRMISFIDLPENAGSFKLVTRKAIDHLVQLQEADPYLRGLVVWVGFKQTKLEYVREARHHGTTQFSLFRSAGPWMELMSGLTSFSLVPLMIPFLCFGVSALALAGIGIAAACGVQFNLVAAMCIFMAFQMVQFLCMGIINIYIGRIWKQSTHRPNTIVESLYNVGTDAGGQIALLPDAARAR